MRPPQAIADTYNVDGALVELGDERPAEPGEHPADGATAFTVALRSVETGEPVFWTAYTVGPAIQDAPSAKDALWSLASDALAVLGAPTDSLAITDPDVREAINEFAHEYGYEDLDDALDAYAACVKTRRAFEELGLDPAELYEDLE